ncbi:hypothetical protein BKA24_001767 [Microbacterium marinum]|uniref:Uncharacterized protein n=1 Tax=Microbacterium marinum TaxID=421115 RepID=A0A7W7FJE0_9MICO|nr:hypothetical protein [Microbacterium marinum]MBB4667058.1 hypothetical protein [Microbacterium marinum]
MTGYIWQEGGRLSADRFGCSLGDDQRGTEYSRRYWRQHDDGTFTVITDAVGVEVVQREGQRAEYVITNAVEFLHCDDRTDPGGTEISSRIDYERGINHRSITNLRDATRAARAYAETYGPEAYELYAGEVAA